MIEAWSPAATEATPQSAQPMSTPNEPQSSPATVSVSEEQQVAVANEVLRMLAQQRAQFEAFGLDAWAARLTDEAVRFFVRLGHSEADARLDIASYMEEHRGDIHALERLVAEQRTTTELGIEAIVSAEMAKLEQGE